MAVGASLLTAGGSAVSASSFNTASVSPVGNELVLLWVMSDSALPNSVTGNGLTWVSVVTNAVNQQVALYRTMGASPSAGAVTIGFPSAQAEVDWILVDYSGVDTSGTNGSGAIAHTPASATGSAVTSLTVTLGTAIAAGNAVAAAVGHDQNQTQTAGGGYTKLGENAAGTLVGDWAHEWRPDGTTTPSMSWATSALAAGLAVEIQAAASAAADFDPLWRYRLRPPGLLAPNYAPLPGPLGDAALPPPSLWVPPVVNPSTGVF